MGRYQPEAARYSTVQYGMGEEKERKGAMMGVLYMKRTLTSFSKLFLAGSTWPWAKSSSPINTWQSLKRDGEDAPAPAPSVRPSVSVCPSAIRSKARCTQRPAASKRCLCFWITASRRQPAPTVGQSINQSGSQSASEKSAVNQRLIIKSVYSHSTKPGKSCSSCP